MSTVRESWTDERLDEFSKRIDERFEEVDRRFDRLETKVDSGFGALEVRFDRLQQTMIQVGGGLIGVLIVGILTLVGTQV